jgi:hypothetical protein
LDARRRAEVSVPGASWAEKWLLQCAEVASISTVRKLAVVARVAARQAGKSRRISALAAGGRVALGSTTRVVSLLWLQVVGFFFLALAALGGFALAREYPRYQAGAVGASKMLLAGSFMALLAYFGVSSFWRTRRKH